MPKVKTLCSLFILVFALPGVARAGLHLYPADGPAPVLKIEQPKPLEYKVQKGDTVAAIAKKFSVDGKALMAANGMTDPRKLQAGKTLKIPGKTAPAVAKAVAKAAPAAPEAKASPAPKPVAQAKVAEEKPDATARRAASKGMELDPGVEVEAPVKGKKGRKGKQEPPAPAPEICIDAKTRSSFGKTGVIMNNTDVPTAIREEFLTYAKKWVDELETIGVGTFRAKKIKQVGGQWEASYRVIMKESLGAEVKRVQYSHTPYVGHITYLQRVFTSVGPTKKAALAGPYTSKDEAIREIFSYSAQKKGWR
jgi:LysM repeat protein